MGRDDARKVIGVVARWLELREQGGYDPLIDSRKFRLEADHSLRGGLLERLLIEGKEPLEYIPPLAFSRPWYGLIEKGEAVIEDMFVHPGIEADTMAICQHQWKILRKEKDSFLLAWRPSHGGQEHWGVWRLTKTPDSWLLSRLG